MLRSIFVLLAALLSLAHHASAIHEFEKMAIVGNSQGEMTHFFRRGGFNYAAGIITGKETSSLVYGELEEGAFLWNKTVEFVDQIFHFGAHAEGFELIASAVAQAEIPGVEEPLTIYPASAAVTVFATLMDPNGDALWVKTFGLDWDGEIGPLAFSASEGDDSTMLIAGNLADQLTYEGQALSTDPEVETFLLTFSEEGEKISEVLDFHQGHDACKSSPCQNGGACDSFEVSYKCKCPSGFSGDNCEITPCTASPCQNKGTCTVKNGTYSCLCFDGFSGETCEITPCSSNPCENGGTCAINGSKYICNCTTSYFGDNCEKLKTPCAPNPCKYDGTCTVNGADYLCNCTQGFLGKDCEQEDLCLSNPCKNGTCTMSGTDYLCKCTQGFLGKNCEQQDLCAPNPCKHDGTCTVNGTDYLCNCPQGFLGKDCEQEDLCLSNPCKNGTCTMNGTDYLCKCAQGFLGKDCEQEDLCLSNPCKNGTCSMRGTDYLCKCTQGFTGKDCEQEDLCLSNPCKNGTCTMKGTDYLCKCTQGFTGKDCEQEDLCFPNPCKNGTCTMNGTDYLCKCTQGFTGKDCDKEDSSSIRRRSVSGGKSFITGLLTGFDDGDEFFTLSTGYKLLDSLYSAFVTLHKKRGNLYERIWTVELEVGENHCLPSISTYTKDSETFIIFVGTVSKSTDFEGFPITVPEKESAAFVSLISLEGTVVWASAIHGIGSFGSQLYSLPIAVSCNTTCQVLVSGPSTNNTRGGAVKIDQWKAHFSFLAAFDVTSGKLAWIKELFPEVATGQVRALQALPDGKVAVAGSVSGDVQLDWLDEIKVEKPSLFVGYLVASTNENPDNEEPTPTVPTTIEESGGYLIPVAIGITLLVGGVICFRWRRGKSRNFRGRKSAGQQYARVNDFEMDNMEDVTVFAIDVEDGRR